MYSCMYFLSLLGIVSTSSIAARQTQVPEAYLSSVCAPPSITAAPLPPCVEIGNIATACLPNGTDPIDLIAHAECMCGGSYFAGYVGCLNCLFVHGGRSPQESSAFNVIITSVSNLLCTGTPTAAYSDLFNSVVASVGPPLESTSGFSDQFPSQSAISLYYTPSGSLGPGAITGSATLATKVPTNTASTGGTSSSGAAPGSGSGPTDSGASPTDTGSGSTSTDNGTPSGSASGSSGSNTSNAGKLGSLTISGLLTIVGAIILISL